jgi:hypothetical protein
MTLHKITELYTEWFSVCPNITSKFLIISMLKNFAEENNDTNKACTHVHDILLYQSLCIKVQRFISCVHKTKY